MSSNNNTTPPEEQKKSSFTFKIPSFRDIDKSSPSKKTVTNLFRPGMLLGDTGKEAEQGTLVPGESARSSIALAPSSSAAAVASGGQPSLLAAKLKNIWSDGAAGSSFLFRPASSNVSNVATSSSSSASLPYPPSSGNPSSISANSFMFRPTASTSGSMQSGRVASHAPSSLSARPLPQRPAESGAQAIVRTVPPPALPNPLPPRPASGVALSNPVPPRPASASAVIGPKVPPLDSASLNSQASSSSSIPPLNPPSTSSASAAPSAASAPTRGSILVNPVQKGNPVLSFIRNVPWQYGENILPDYVVGRTSCVLFLSLRYHRLHPDYIHTRIKQLGKQYLLRVLLIQIDVEDHHQTLKELTIACIHAGLTMILAWSAEEAAKYIETYKSCEYKPPDILKERIDDSYIAKMTDCLTSIKSVNKTDVVTLVTTFGSLKNIINASPEEVSLCPGFGDQKVRRMEETFTRPFKARRMNT